jgi:hypothetical protein
MHMNRKDALKAGTLLLTPNGSRLYGLAHANSDDDYYRVVLDDYFYDAVGKVPTGNRNRLIHHAIVDGVDELTVGFGTFARLAFDGTPQTLETMFSQQSIIDRLEEFRQSYYASTGPDSMRDAYRRTIHRFIYGNFKARRHALRLSINLEESMRSGGRFNPTLTPEQAAYITAAASSNPEEYLRAVADINHYEVSDSYNMEELEKNFADSPGPA